ncbi:MAG: FG-GAP-like repeat-containing protein [candidate division Zixibacteria bacterium]|nr:FG-GAP-like repeat-containing protein [candidate division Zixibacteria bacterium]
MFDADLAYDTQGEAVNLCSADFDQDGDEDLAIANMKPSGWRCGYSSGVAIIMNNGDGTYEQAVVYSAGYDPRDIAALDIDTDGDDDLVVVSGDSVIVLFNSGLGTFGTTTSYYVENWPCDICATDLDMDGDNDIAVCGQRLFQSMVSVLINGGGGVLDPPVNYEAGGSLPTALCATDLDGDSDIDLITANSLTDDVSILLNNGDATFQSQITVEAGYQPSDVLAMDVDQDGDNDIIVANTGRYQPYPDGQPASIIALLNIGDGTFQSTEIYSEECNSSFPLCSVFPVDTDGDNDTDLVAGNGLIFTNNGSGTFSYQVGCRANVHGITYCDSDGNVDLVELIGRRAGEPEDCGTSLISVYRNHGNEIFKNYNFQLSHDADPSDVIIVDVDGDGDKDLITSNSYSENISVLLNNDNGSFQQPLDYDAGSYPSSIVAVDLDKDGDSDLVAANREADSVSILLNDGFGSFQLAANYSVGGWGDGPRCVFAVDLDADNDADLVAANSTAQLIILFNAGNGTFPTSIEYDIGFPGGAFCVFAIDLDGDGDNDLASGHQDGLAIAKNNGDGSFQAASYYGNLWYPSSLFSCDLDGDGDNDIVMDSYVFSNNGDGTFQNEIRYGYSEGTSVIAHDFDADGDRDIALGSWFGYVTIFENDGYGHFQFEHMYATAFGSNSVAAADLDGDGTEDLAIANYLGDNVSIFFNLGVVTDVDEIESPELPTTYSIDQNYPNPFNPMTQIEFEIPRASFVEIHIYNMLGQQLRTLVSERLSAGRRVVTWDGTDDRSMPVASGVYFYRISTDGYTDAKKMILLK